jgi:hypothetical protein
MPVADMFWGNRYGQLMDPFGHFWSIATHKQDLTPEQLEKAGEVAMKEMMTSKNRTYGRWHICSNPVVLLQDMKIH